MPVEKTDPLDKYLRDVLCAASINEGDLANLLNELVERVKRLEKTARARAVEPRRF